MTKRTLLMVAMLFAFAAPGIFGDNPMPTCGPCPPKPPKSGVSVARVVLPMLLAAR